MIALDLVNLPRQGPVGQINNQRLPVRLDDHERSAGFEDPHYLGKDTFGIVDVLKDALRPSAIEGVVGKVRRAASPT